MICIRILLNILRSCIVTSIFCVQSESDHDTPNLVTSTALQSNNYNSLVAALVQLFPRHGNITRDQLTNNNKLLWKETNINAYNRLNPPQIKSINVLRTVLHTVSGQNPIRASQFLLALLADLEKKNGMQKQKN